MNEIIKLNHVSKKFNNELVLKDINAILHKGEILGFLGPSGAGKTTTIKIITGQLHQTSGEACIFGIDSKNIDETIYEQIGIVTDMSGVYERLTVYDNLRYFSKIHGVDKKEIDILLERVGLLEHKNKLASKLSKGQTQRLVLSRAILHKPKVLFLDEPTSGLDPSTALKIHQLLLELKSEGMAIFLTTHNMEEATKLCDHVALLNDGKIVEFGTPHQLCLKYNTEKKYHVLLDDKKEYVIHQTKEDLSQLNEWLLENRIETLHSCEPTLETVFLKVTGRGLE
ncbi:MAG: ABC transporter ATP-binding protein [Longibaculum sp.]